MAPLSCLRRCPTRTRPRRDPDSSPDKLTLLGWISCSASAGSLQRLTLADGALLAGQNSSGEPETLRAALVVRGQTALLALRSLSCAGRLEAHQPEAADLLQLLPRGGRELTFGSSCWSWSH